MASARNLWGAGPCGLARKGRGNNPSGTRKVHGLPGSRLIRLPCPALRGRGVRALPAASSQSRPRPWVAAVKRQLGRRLVSSPPWDQLGGTGIPGRCPGQHAPFCHIVLGGRSRNELGGRFERIVRCSRVLRPGNPLPGGTVGSCGSSTRAGSWFLCGGAAGAVLDFTNLTIITCWVLPKLQVQPRRRRGHAGPRYKRVAAMRQRVGGFHGLRGRQHVQRRPAATAGHLFCNGRCVAGPAYPR